MINFRKSLIALALVALCAGMAMAQGWQTPQTIPNYTLATLRAEGVTELIQPVTVAVSDYTTVADATGVYNITLFVNGGPLITSSANEVVLTDVYGATNYTGVIGAAGNTVTFSNVTVTRDPLQAGVAHNRYALTVSGVRVNATTMQTGFVSTSNGVTLTLWAVPTAANVKGPQGLFGGQALYQSPVLAYAFNTLTLGVQNYTSATIAAKTYAYAVATSTTAPVVSACDTTDIYNKTDVTVAPATNADGSQNYTKVADVTLAETLAKQFTTLADESTNDPATTATSGVRFAVTFTGIPTGTALYIPATVGSTGTTVAKVIKSGVDATGASTAAIVYQTGFVAITAGTTVFVDVTTSSTSTDTIKIPVVVKYTGTAALTPVTGAVTVAAQLAPFASATSTSIPRFQSTAQTKSGLFSIAACSTTLLFPYVTNATDGSWNTAVAIANTASDPFTTTGQAGICTVNFYGTDGTGAAAGKTVYYGANVAGAGAFAATAAAATSIAPGTVATDLLSSTVAYGKNQFSGYAIAVCGFQYAHGYSFVIGKNAMGAFSNGYLALVLGQGKANPLSRTANYGQYEQVAY